MAKQVRNELCDDELSRASCTRTRVAPNIVVFYRVANRRESKKIASAPPFSANREIVGALPSLFVRLIKRTQGSPTQAVTMHRIPLSSQRNLILHEHATTTPS